METENFTPEKSLALIEQIINEAKCKFEENGFIYVFWGALTAVAAIGQYILLNTEYNDISYYPYFLMPLGAVFNVFYFSKKKRKSANLISKIISYAWIIISINTMALGFFFAPILQVNLIPILLILLSIGIVISGATIKNNVLLFSGIILNISAFVCFYLDWIYQPLLMGIASIIAIFIPGLILMQKHKKTTNV